MPRIFDNIDQSLLPALRETLNLADRADFCVGYFNLRGWKQIDEYSERWAGGPGQCCRLLVGMQRLAQDQLRDALSLVHTGDGIDNQTAIHLKKKLAEEFRQQLMVGTPTNADEAGLRRLAAQIKAKKVIVKLYLRHQLHAKLYLLFRPEPIVSRAARLICATAEYDDLAQEIGLRGHQDGATDPAERARLRAELDGLIAHLYGLTEEEFAYILTAFPVVPQPVKDAALEAYHRFAPASVDAEIGALLAQGEGPRVEFKSSARWDLKENKKNGELEKVIVKTVAGFLNGDGGTLLIGVDDDGTIIGLQHDYQAVHKKSRDGYELFLHDLLLDSVGKDLTPQLGITFHSLDGKDLCQIAAQPSPRPVFIKEGVDEHLYIRSGNSTRRLTSKETVDYCKTRWKGT